MTTSNQYLACPSDFLAPNALTITNSSEYTYLQFKEKEFIQTFTPNASTTGVPRFYAQFDVDNFVIAPTPDSGYTVNLSYFYRPASLTDSTISFTVSSSSSFTVGETITGGTSGFFIYLRHNRILVKHKRGTRFALRIPNRVLYLYER
jgi:hypothetical protein